jgi:plasmid stabilization system protein ParE
MRVRFLAAATKEFSDAVSYYDSQKEGLGDEFADEVWRTISRIVSHPLAWQPLSARTRRCLTRRFPYGVIYQARSDSILIIAVMHLRRHPESWRGRVKDE